MKENNILNCDIYCKNQNNITSILNTLWTDQLHWIRAAIVSIIGGLDDVSQISARLLETPKLFSEFFRIFYGYENAEKLDKLIQEHLLITLSIINDYIAKDEITHTTDREKWFENADNLAMFLSQINPFGSREHWQELFYEYLIILEEAIDSRYRKQYNREFNNYEKMKEQVEKIAQYMAEGIKRQFNM